MIEAFGGKPLSEAEYKSSELRNQRTGLDYSAMEFAYKVYHLNNGYSIMYAPNGENSILYNTLLQELGDPKKALLAKAHFYTNDYLSKNGDWISSKTNSSIKLDVNGEPYINLDENKKSINGVVSKFGVSSNKTFFGGTFDTIMSGEAVSSSDIVSNILSNNLLSDQNVALAEILQKHNIPVKISSSVGYDFMTTYTDEHGQSIILINPSLVGKASNKLTADTFLHEVVHALTVNAFNNPVSKEDRNLVSSTRELHKIMDKLYPREIYDRSNRESGMYALTNPKEFIAEFISNKHTRDLVYKTAVQLDKQSGKTLLGKIKSLINSITKFLVNKNLFKTNEERV